MNLTWWIGRAMSSNSVLVAMLRVYLLLFAAQFVHSQMYDSSLNDPTLMMLFNLQTEDVNAINNQSVELLGVGFIDDKLMGMTNNLNVFEMSKTALDTAKDEWHLNNATKYPFEQRWPVQYSMLSKSLKANDSRISAVFTGAKEKKGVIFFACQNQTNTSIEYYFISDVNEAEFNFTRDLYLGLPEQYISAEKDYIFVFSQAMTFTILYVIKVNFSNPSVLQEYTSMAMCKGDKEDQIRIDQGSPNSTSSCLPLAWDITSPSLYINGRFYLFGDKVVYMFTYDPIEENRKRQVSTTVDFKKKSFGDFFILPPTNSTTTTPVPTNATTKSTPLTSITPNSSSINTTAKPSSSTTTATVAPQSPSPSSTVGPTDGSSSKTSAYTSPSPTKAPQPKPEPETRLTSDNVTVTSETTTAKSSLTMIIIIVLVLVVALIILFVLYCLCCRKKKEDEKKADDKSKKKPVTDKDKKSTAKDKKDDKAKQTAIKSVAKAAPVVGAGKASKSLVKSSVKEQKSSSKGRYKLKGSLSAGNAFKSKVSSKDGIDPKEKQTIGLDKYSSTLSKQSNTGNSSLMLTTGSSNDFGGSSVISKASTTPGGVAGGRSLVLSQVGSSISKGGASVRSVRSVSTSNNNPAPSKNAQAKNAAQPKSSVGKSSANKKNK